MLPSSFGRAGPSPLPSCSRTRLGHTPTAKPRADLPPSGLSPPDCPTADFPRLLSTHVALDQRRKLIEPLAEPLLGPVAFCPSHLFNRREHFLCYLSEAEFS